MKKLYAFFAAALMSVSVFAAKDVVPSDAVLAEYYDAGQVCVCFFVPADMACYDAVLTGSFNSWSSNLANCVACEAVEGYDGWYVASFEPEAEPDAEKGIQAKPIMKDATGAFNWDYQVGAATVIRGGVQVVAGGIAGEIDMINYGTDAPNVFTVDAWKSNPCTAVYHNYKFTVISDGCGGLAVPFIVGGFTDWAPQEMTIDQAKTIELGAPVYTYSAKLAEETGYQVLSGLRDAETGAMDSTAMPGWNDDSYLQKLIDGVWGRIPGESGDNLLTHQDVDIVIDVRAEDLRWARCNDEVAEYTIVAVNLPVENRPEAVEIIGGFDAWEGTAMELLNTGWFFVELEAKPSQFFKFRGAGSWDQEIELYNAEDDTWAKIQDNQLIFGQLWQEDTYKGTPCKWIELDFSEMGRWTVKEEAIENVVLTEKAQKVVVDGVIYIVRDNKMFTIQGAQVR